MVSSGPWQPSPNLERLRQEIIAAAEMPSFIHHSWYVKYHLRPVEAIASELADVYPSADRKLVFALVWLHDYGKMISDRDDRRVTLVEGRKKLLEIGFPLPFSDRVVDCIAMMDHSSEIVLADCPIEVQIVSSADGCSHLVGPFFHLWFWENPGKPFEDLMESNRNKAAQAWAHKIVLPEARAAFGWRHDAIMSLNGVLPDRYLMGPR